MGKINKFLLKGTIYLEGEFYNAKDMRGKLITWDDSLEGCQKALMSFYSDMFMKLPFEIKFDVKTSLHCNFSVYKRGKRLGKCHDE